MSTLQPPLPPWEGKRLCTRLCFVCVRLVEVVRVKMFHSLAGEGRMAVPQVEEGVWEGGGSVMDGGMKDERGGGERSGILLHYSPVFRGSDT